VCRCPAGGFCVAFIAAGGCCSGARRRGRICRTTLLDCA
jgi:hypothetical protein